MNQAAPTIEVPTEGDYPKAYRFEMLDSWRGLCCLMLVVFHAAMQTTRDYFWEADQPVDSVATAFLWLASRAWIGVPIFFVISGYCIMATLTSRQRKGGVKEFAKRRFHRIYPPYWIALAIASVIILLVQARMPGVFSDGVFTIQSPDQMSLGAWIGNLTLTESWRYILFGGEPSHLLPNTWTLAYEEQFYVVAAMVLLLMPRRILTAFAVFTVFAMSGKVISKLTGIEVGGSIFDGQWLLIANGLLLYYRVHFAKGWQVHAIHLLLALGIVAHLAQPHDLLAAMPNHDIDRFVAFSFTLFMSLMLPWDKKIGQSALLKPLRACGAISYSIYLSHGLLVKGLSFAAYRAGWTSPEITVCVVVPVCLVLSIAVGYVFYWLVERHFISSRSKTRTESQVTGWWKSWRAKAAASA